MQETITKDESLTKNSHLHKPLPMLTTNNTYAKSRNDTITRDSAKGQPMKWNLLNQSVQQRAQTY